MLPAPQRFISRGNPLPTFSFSNPSQPFISHTIQDSLHHQGHDPNSPELFKHNIHTVHEQVIQLQSTARRVLSRIQNAYQTGNNPLVTESEIENLKQNLYLVIETMRNTGVGALPLLPLQQNSEAVPVPTEQQLLTDTTRSLQALYEKVQRSYDSASAVVNLLSTDHVPRSGK